MHRQRGASTLEKIRGLRLQTYAGIWGLVETKCGDIGVCTRDRAIIHCHGSEAHTTLWVSRKWRGG